MTQNPIFAKRITILHKNGYKQEYTHVIEFRVLNPLPRINDIHPLLLIKGEVTDSMGYFPKEVIDKLSIKDLHTTIIDWYLPRE